jgi:hypothetical protein
MARKAHGIGDLTETEQQSGYDPIRFAKQIEGCRAEIRVDARGFKYTAYVRIEPRKKDQTDRIKNNKVKGKTAKITKEGLQDLSFDLDLI